MPNVVQVVIHGVDQFSGTLSKATKDFAAFKNLAATAILAAGGALASAATAAAALTIEAIRSAEATGLMAQKAGIAVEEFSALAYSARLVHVEQESLVKAAKAWSIEAAKGNSITGNFTQDLLILADQFQNSSNGALKVARAIDVFGKKGQDLIPILNQGSVALREQMDEARKFGLVIGDDFAHAAHEFDANLERLHAALQGLWLTVGREFLPLLIELSEKMLEMAREHLPGLGKEVRILAETIRHPLNPSLAAANVLARDLQEGLSKMVGVGVKGLKSLAPAAEEALFDPKKAKEAEKLWNQMLETAKKSSEDLTTMESGLLAEEKRRYLDRLEQIQTLAQTEDQRRRLEFAAESEHYARLRQLDLAYNRSRLQLQANYAQGVQTIFGNLATVAQAFGKKGFAAFKAFRIAEAIASTYAGAARALADFPWPFSIAVAASVVAAGLANVATIAASKPGGQAHGGLNFVPNESTFLLQRGERVVQPNANEDLTRYLEQANAGAGGRMMQVQINLDGAILAKAIGRLSRDGRLELDPRSIT